MNGVFGPPWVIASPETMSTRPSASVVVVGYQRARDMSGPAVHEPASGLSSRVIFRPSYAFVLCPPATNSRPSGSSVWPEQNRLKPDGVAANEDVAGSQIRSEPTAASNASQTATFPFESIDACTATSGQSAGCVQPPSSSCDWPGGSASGSPTGVAMSAATSAAVSARSYTRTSSIRPANHSSHMSLPPIVSAPSPGVSGPLRSAFAATWAPLTNSRSVVPSYVAARCVQASAWRSVGARAKPVMAPVVLTWALGLSPP